MGKKAFELPKKLEYIEDHTAIILSDDINGNENKNEFGGLIFSARDYYNIVEYKTIIMYVLWLQVMH